MRAWTIEKLRGLLEQAEDSSDFDEALLEMLNRERKG